ncbi:MAG: UbiD family decarboxylase [Desulfobacterales bacterium]|nr:UbiD family decarboxylase [Desulfobacterales bacterium]
MKYYADMREYIGFLESKGKLIRIKREINKDLELHPLVRWQFRGLAEKDRKAFLFENVIDAAGKKYDIPVLVAAHAPSTEIYAMAMNCEPDQILEKWADSERNPIPPKMVAAGPVQEEIHVGDSLLEHGGMGEFPVPISTPGFDSAPFLTAGNWVTKDPDTGIINVANHRAMVKAPLRLGCLADQSQHIRIHWEKYRRKGSPTMPAAIVIGPPPNVGLVATAKVPYESDEYHVAGGMAGSPLELVKCQTIDLEVPASAEIVLEGHVPTDQLETEGPFGEFPGYMGMGGPNLYMDITCITHRKRPIFNAFLSQFPTSESSTLRGVSGDGTFYKFLKYDLSISSIKEVFFHRESGARPFCVLCFQNPRKAEVWSALKGADALAPGHIKMIIAVDDDIDPKDADSVIWALGYRMQPHRDMLITNPSKTSGLDPSVAPPEEMRKRGPTAHYGSTVLIDATRKWDYPPVSLPTKELMERAKKIWEEEGLPPLTPKKPWYGYPLGYWKDEDQEDAERALRGEHYLTGEKHARNRVKPRK